MDSIWDLANSHLRDLGLYEPGKPIEETARECGLPAEDRQAGFEREPARPLAPRPRGDGICDCRREFLPGRRRFLFARSPGEEAQCRAGKHRPR